MKSKHILRSGWGLLLVTAVGACHAVAGEDDCTTELTPQVTPQSQALAVGQSFTPQAALLTCGGQRRVDAVFTWTAAHTTVLQVDPGSGRATGRRPGATQLQGRTSVTGAGPVVSVAVTVR